MSVCYVPKNNYRNFIISVVWNTGQCSVIGRFLPDYMVSHSRGPKYIIPCCENLRCHTESLVGSRKNALCMLFLLGCGVKYYTCAPVMYLPREQALLFLNHKT
jgi:hypothetical protein